MPSERAPEFSLQSPLASALAVIRTVLLSPRSFYRDFEAEGPLEEPALFVLLVGAVTGFLGAADVRGGCTRSILPTVIVRTPDLARALTNALNPFFIFTVLYALVAFAEDDLSRAVLYLAVELLAAGAVAGFVLFMRRRSRVGDFWITARAERLTPALLLLFAFIALLGALALLDAPRDLFLLTLSMGLASATVALITLVWKASAHCAVAGHAAAAGLLLFGSLGVLFLLVLPPVVWSRVAVGAHTLTQALAGTAAGVGFATLFLA